MTMEQMQARPGAIVGGERRLFHAAGVAALALAFLAMAGAAGAQQRVRPGQTVSHPVVQPLPSQDSLKLNAALSRLGRDPRDLGALIDAGNAALAMGDADAATGFFRRADQVSANDPRVKAGLAGALVRGGKPLEALPLFDAAERAGAKPAAIAADRGLAYDLVGDNATAQRLYRLALERGPDEEVTRRLAVSLAISGDRRGSDAALLPLLRKQDKPAWRTRTFALAILGEADEAVRTARTILPQNLAESMSPYLRYMPQLTRAQQAAAANLGDFPRASEIGRDDPRYAAVAAPALAVADSASVARASQPARDSDHRRRAERASTRQAARVAPSVPQPMRQSAQQGTQQAAAPAAPARSMSAPVTASAATPVPPLAAIAEQQGSRSARAATGELPALPGAKPAVAASPSTPASAPAPASGASIAAAPPPATLPATASAQLDAPAARISLAEAFRDFGKPSTSITPAPGAVDISHITPARPKVEPAKPEPAKVAPPKPAPPSHPSRIWVQLGIGQNRRALAIDWNRLARKAAAAFKGQKPFVSEMGQTNRMLAGPFDSTAQANKFVAALHEAGIDGPYIWTSPAGQVVDALPPIK
jgi:tetratricopeptide (TPR) repeat protein